MDKNSEYAVVKNVLNRNPDIYDSYIFGLNVCVHP